jgi:hypothetical protein
MLVLFKNISILFLILLIVGSCTERINIDLDSQKFARLVVEGEFSSDTAAHIVRLTVSEDYFSNAMPVGVSNAQLTISGDGEEYSLSETTAGSGIYATDPQVYGTINTDYTLRIILDEAIGGQQEYTSTSKIHPINPLDSIGLEFHEDWGEQGIWEVKCYVWDPPTEDYYMFHVYRNNMLINDTIDEVFVVDDALYNGNYTNGIGVAYLNQANDNEQLFAGDIVGLRVSRITKEYSEFLWSLQEEISYQSPLFSGPPANVKGNISDGAFGAFGAYSTTYASKVVF